MQIIPVIIIIFFLKKILWKVKRECLHFNNVLTRSKSQINSVTLHTPHTAEWAHTEMGLQGKGSSRLMTLPYLWEVSEEVWQQKGQLS